MATSFYSHLLFDLDHTLWDFERNSEETLRELYREGGLEKNFVSENTVGAGFEVGELMDILGIVSQ